MPPTSPPTAPSDLEPVFEAFPELSNPQATVLAGGLIHRTFLIRDGASADEPDANPREFILQRVNPIFRPEIHHNIEPVTKRLAEAGLETFHLIPSGDGRPYARLANGEIWRLMTRIEGQSFVGLRSPEQANSAGRLLARFHSALDGFATEFAPTGLQLHNLGKRLDALNQAREAYSTHPLHAQVEALASKIESAAKKRVPVPALPSRVTHGDLKLNNLLFRENTTGHFEAISLIDLDTLGRTPLYFDLGDAWRSWCNPSGENAPKARFDFELFEASLDGYLGELRFPLETAERRSLALGVEELSLELAARFATDALDETYFAWDESRYARAGEHNLARARNQFDLYERTLATREQRLGLLMG